MKQTLLLLLLVMSGCTQNKEVVNMPKVLFIIAQQGFRDEELLEPKAVLENAGIKVEVASITRLQAVGSIGVKVEPDLAIEDAIPEDYVYIVVVGGQGAPELAEHQEVIEALQKANNIAAICIGPTVLAKAGLLNGKKATVFKTPESVAILEEGGAIFVDQDIVVDGTLVTANGPHVAKEFGKQLLKSITGNRQ
ncbi:MAG: DJ-1/PfpI family protein [Candidatus Woesearchaeota archaeon]